MLLLAFPMPSFRFSEQNQYNAIMEDIHTSSFSSCECSQMILEVLLTVENATVL